MWAAKWVAVVAAEGDGGAGIFEDGELVVGEAVGAGAFCECVDGGGFAEEGDDGIDEVAGELEHAAAGILAHFFELRIGEEFAHARIDLRDVAQPAFAGGAEEQLKCGIVAEHVAHLDGEAALCCCVAHGAKFGVVGGTWLVEVDVFSSANRCERCAGGVGERGLYDDCADGGIGE